jgi:tRNA dimethylallyltransferase
MSTVICLMGPTASGKTALALELARILPIDMISVDAVMIYRGMDIGTSKPNQTILAEIPHYLVNIRDPAETYSVGDFCRDVYQQIEMSIAAKRIPLLVGGSMMYFRALERGLADLPHANIEVRKILEQEGAALGWPALHRRLAELDPRAAARIHPHDKQRIQRALEVYTLSGESISSHQEKTRVHQAFSYQWFALLPDDRLLLHKKIEERFLAMLNDGLVSEVETLFNRGDLSPIMQSMRSVNYRQVWGYLAGVWSYDEMTAQAIAATRQLAKRQITWLRSFSDLQILSGDVNECLKLII